MNKRKLKTILNLYRDGASRNLCVQNILALSKTYFEASIWIDKFYKEIEYYGITPAGTQPANMADN